MCVFITVFLVKRYYKPVLAQRMGMERKVFHFMVVYFSLLLLSAFSFPFVLFHY